MEKVNVRVKYEGGQGTVRGLHPDDSLEKLISHSLESLGLPETNTNSLRLLTGTDKLGCSVPVLPGTYPMGTYLLCHRIGTGTDRTVRYCTL